MRLVLRLYLRFDFVFSLPLGIFVILETMESHGLLKRKKNREQTTIFIFTCYQDRR